MRRKSELIKCDICKKYMSPLKTMFVDLPFISDHDPITCQHTDNGRLCFFKVNACQECLRKSTNLRCGKFIFGDEPVVIDADGSIVKFDLVPRGQYKEEETESE